MLLISILSLLFLFIYKIKKIKIHLILYIIEVV